MIKVLKRRIAEFDGRAAKPMKYKKPALYSSKEYRAWRAKVINRANGVCQAPGCGRADQSMYADHIEELKDGGDPFDPANGQCLCASHHQLKTAEARRNRQRRREDEFYI